MSVKVTFVDRGFSEFIRRLKTDQVEISVGVFENKDVRTRGRNLDLTNTQIAIFNEFGAGPNPPRPFLRPTLVKHAVKYMRMMAKAYTTYLKTGKRTFSDLGKTAAEDVRATIDSVVPPPNAQRTVDRKGHGHTLIETKQMRDAISYRTRFKK